MTSRLTLKKKRKGPPSEKMEQDANSSYTVCETKNKKLFDRAIANAQKHKINLKPGRENRGGGNCSYEAVIFNINDRNCFQSKFHMSLDHYRVIWTTDTMNKILDEKIPWNPGLTRTEIVQGFRELQVSGVYERDFFGDMMMVGIACGVRKIILIFNTHEDIARTGHDPISVIDPRDYEGEIDSEIPVVVAYNLVHYESLEPLCSDDVRETIKLVRSYNAKPSRYKQDYGFCGKDISYLVSQMENVAKPSPEQLNDPPKKQKNDIQEAENDNSKVSPKKYKKAEEITGFVYEDILFKETGNDKVQCGGCQVECSRLILHMNGNEYCTEYFSNMANFKLEYSRYRHKQSQRQKKEQKEVERQESSCEYQGLQQVAKSKIEGSDTNVPKTMEVKADQNFEGFRYEGILFEELPQNKVRCGICQKECGRLIVHINGSRECIKNFSNTSELKKEYSKYRNRKRKRESDAKRKFEDPQGFKEKVNESIKKYEAKQKAKDPEGFKENANKRKREHMKRKKAEDPQGYKEKVNESIKKYEAKQKDEDPKGFKENANKRKRKHDNRKRAEDPKGFKENENRRKREHDSKKKNIDPDGFRDNLRERRCKSDNNFSAAQRLAKFRRRVKYGPIFVCSCCHQKLFENQVHMLTNNIRAQIDEGNPGIRQEYIEEEIEIEIGKEKAPYLCKSCKGYLQRGKLPKLCVKNGLQVDQINDDLKLTELEKNLIAKNIIFQKIHKMPKSRWSGTHDRLVNVPVNPEDVLNTIDSIRGWIDTNCSCEFETKIGIQEYTLNTVS